MSASCVFCERQSLEPRVFYDHRRLVCLSSGTPSAEGHTILAVKNSRADCRTALWHEYLQGLDIALAGVVQALLRRYPRPQDVLVASLRGKDPHVHWHLVPLWQGQERGWRRQSLNEEGHLFEFLGHVEKTAQSKAQHERTERGWSEEEQRAHLQPDLQPDVDSLRAIIGYASGLTCRCSLRAARMRRSDSDRSGAPLAAERPIVRRKLPPHGAAPHKAALP